MHTRTLLPLVLLGCVADEPVPESIPGTSVRFDLAAAREGGQGFYDAPYPLDLRLNARGGPPLLGLPGLGQPNDLLLHVAETAEELRGYPTLPVAWFRFDAAPAPGGLDRIIPAEPDADVLLVDIDPESPFRGELIPTVAAAMPEDAYLPGNVLGVAPVPGFVLRPETTYAFVVRRSWRDVEGEELGVPAEMLALLRGEAPDRPWGEEAARSYAPLVETLADLGIEPEEVAAAAVFTTGDAVADNFALSERVRELHQPRIEGLALAVERGATHPTYCELHGTLVVPEFQDGHPPYDTGGRFVFDENGDPVVQRQIPMPVVVTVPKAEMPAEGFPLALYFHGSGGTSDQLVIRGPQPGPGEPNQVGYGPAHVLALRGIAGAGSAHPVNPERVPGAGSLAYLNFQNLAAFRDTFFQGALEQRLYLDALLDLRIDPAVLEGCDGPTLPDGADAFFFDPDHVVAMGQSMGGMYVNLVGAIDPRIGAVVPTGSGGHWSRFILLTNLLGGAQHQLLGLLLGTDVPLSFLHPALHVAQTAWEPVEPLVSVPRLARRPLPGQPVRPIYEPVGLGDSYFPPEVFDAMALGFGTVQAGEVVWPTMQDALALDGREGLADYPVSQNRTSEDGRPYTGVVVQYEGDGFSDPHVIFTQLDAVKHQYGCFLQTWVETGVAVVPEGGATDDPCP